MHSQWLRLLLNFLIHLPSSSSLQCRSYLCWQAPGQAGVAERLYFFSSSCAQVDTDTPSKTSPLPRRFSHSPAQMLWLLQDLGLCAHAYAPMWGFGFMFLFKFTKKTKKTEYLLFYLCRSCANCVCLTLKDCYDTDLNSWLSTFFQ